MTTRINITVDQSGLLSQAANQTRANHEALVIQQEQKKTEETGLRKLKKQRRSLGQDVKTGEPLPIAPPPSGGIFDINGSNRIGQYPAANRRTDRESERVSVIITYQLGIAVPIPDTESFETGYVTVTYDVSIARTGYLLLIEKSKEDFNFRNPLVLFLIEAVIDLSSGVPVFSGYELRASLRLASYTVQALEGARVINSPLEGWPPEDIS